MIRHLLAVGGDTGLVLAVIAVGVAVSLALPVVFLIGWAVFATVCPAEREVRR